MQEQRKDGGHCQRDKGEYAEQEPRCHIRICSGIQTALKAERRADNFIAERNINSAQATHDADKTRQHSLALYSVALIVVIDYFGADTVEGNKYTRNSYTHNAHYSGGKEHFFSQRTTE